MKITYVSCFCTNEIPSGNPAAVVENFVGNDQDKQKLATKLSFPATVFVEYRDKNTILRFFYPSREMPLCIHGTLSAAYVLMHEKKLNALRILTKSNQEMLIKRLKDIVQLEIDPGAVLSIAFAMDDINKMLNIDYHDDLNKNLPNCIASIGSPKLLIPLKYYESLATLKPDFAFIKQWSVNNNVNGLYVYTDDVRDEEADFIASDIRRKALNGDMEQDDRNLAVLRFANQSCSILVATDVAARGLDIKELSAVINFDLAFDHDVHIHRIGRTGRAGKRGKALTFV